MSTAGSGHRHVSGYGPQVANGPKPVTGSPRPAARRLFRWQGIFALLFFAVVIGGGWLLFADLIIKSTIAEAATKALGVEVAIDKLHLGLSDLSLDIRGFTVAHPRDSMMNVLEVGHARVQLAGAPLLRERVVITSLVVDSVRGLTRRARPAKVVKAGGFLPGAMAEAGRFAAQFRVPLLSLTPIDTIRSLVLDPSQLQTVQRAKALAAHADSVKDNTISRVQALRLGEVADSAEALLNRLKGQDPRTLGISGTRAAVADVRRFSARVDSTKRAIANARAGLEADADALTESVKSLDDARQADYAFARGLLKLPTFDAPNIGPALFGQVSLDAFEKAMYWVELGRKYAPPGLLPRESPGPKRMRRAGTTIHFVTQGDAPRFHLQRAAFNLTLDEAAGALRGTYALNVADVTDDPALLGKPTMFSFTRAARAAGLESLLVVGTLDHTKPIPTETIVMRAGGVSLPKFAVPGVPLRLDLGKGASTLRFNVVGDSVVGRWTVGAPRPAWSPDTARQRAQNTLTSLVTRVLTGIDNVDVTADIRGTTAAPSLAVRSNLDRAVADNIKRVAGEEISRAEAKMRAQVDAVVQRETAALKVKIDKAVADTREQADQRIAEAQARLDKAKADLAARLKELGGGIIG
jgi:uncharacterized protein (TIGR03545 family)